MVFSLVLIKKRNTRDGKRNIVTHISDCTYTFNKFVINRTVFSLKIYTAKLNTFIIRFKCVWSINSFKP